LVADSAVAVPEGVTPVGPAAGAALAERSVPDGPLADGSLADGSLDGEPVPDADGQSAGVVLLDPDRTGADEPD